MPLTDYVPEDLRLDEITRIAPTTAFPGHRIRPPFEYPVSYYRGSKLGQKLWVIVSNDDGLWEEVPLSIRPIIYARGNVFHPDGKVEKSSEHDCHNQASDKILERGAAMMARTGDLPKKDREKTALALQIKGNEKRLQLLEDAKILTPEGELWNRVQGLEERVNAIDLHTDTVGDRTSILSRQIHDLQHAQTQTMDKRTYLVGCCLTGLLSAGPGALPKFTDGVPIEAVRLADETLKAMGDGDA